MIVRSLAHMLPPSASSVPVWPLEEYKGTKKQIGNQEDSCCCLWGAGRSHTLHGLICALHIVEPFCFSLRLVTRDGAVVAVSRQREPHCVAAPS
jgi:hypothetical protein